MTFLTWVLPLVAVANFRSLAFDFCILGCWRWCWLLLWWSWTVHEQSADRHYHARVVDSFLLASKLDATFIAHCIFACWIVKGKKWVNSCTSTTREGGRNVSCDYQMGHGEAQGTVLARGRIFHMPFLRDAQAVETDVALEELVSRTWLACLWCCLAQTPKNGY